MCPPASGFVHIRRATCDDQGVIEGIISAAFSPYITRIGRKPAPMLADYGALIDARSVHVVECEEQVPGMRVQGACLQGVLVLVPQPEAMLLDAVAVAPVAQGRGIGRRMLAFAEQEARAAGYGVITLYTHEAMTENLSLYRHCGYVETRRAQENGFSRVYMRKVLSQG